ncbi:LysM peptidoglycan-binding domain-containing protein [Gilvibacter sediminis]|uniref:LysM peptidoglycan-binding domain-containing protein n=1 Tax=Gilvibacter sediminis TaxID=379071 RepID=UPI0023500CBA|nr:LysM peptidoglycan-binding domain-containing protein [Gilvibacter sediminis]MDC7998826.1 LysM peptidoglycan-binding domain-containing protein [Gilvibacter sediminis]
MKGIKIGFLLFFVALTTAAAAQTSYKSHNVKQGETVFSIAKQYGVTEEAIYRLNPDARQGIQENNILIIPTADDQTNYSEQVVDFKRHRVKRKETLFSIAQKYGVTVDDIKKYNKRLYSEQLRKGDKIMIPVLERTVVVTTDANTGNTGNTGNLPDNTTVKDTTKVHTVLPKETKYGIARKYGISIAELEALNPQIGDTLQMGAVLKVPQNEVVADATVDDSLYDFYEVQPKEGFYRLKVKFGLTEDEIVALNPYAKDGLKAGMILKLPKMGDAGTEASANVVNLEYQISNYDTKKLVVMLPFNLTKVSRDSVEANEDLLINSRTLNIALDFYSGVMMAADFAKDKGLSVDLQILDTEGKSSKVNQLIAQGNFDEVDAVIGPLFQKNATSASNALRRADIPVLSPLSNQQANGGRNFFNTVPSNDFLEARMMEYLQANSAGKNLIIIADAKKAREKNMLRNAFPNAKVLDPREEQFLYVVDIQNQLDPIADNWVVLASDNPVLVSNVIGLLNGLPPDKAVRLFTLDKSDAYEFEDIQNSNLARLKFTYPSVYRSFDYDNPEAFVTSYKNKYGVYPNRFAIRGFDVTYDCLLRLGMAESLYDAIDLDGETQYVGNKFFYVRSGSGYANNAGYIMMYGEDLKLIEVE